MIQPRLDAYREEGIPFEGSENVLKFLDENKQLLSTRPIIRMHGDYHTGNLIVNDGKLYVIDWHVVDFDNLGAPWYEFNRLATEYPSYAKGQIDGYFRNNVPDEFWKLFAFYLSTSAITSIVWAKYWAPEELSNIMELNLNVQKMFDNMKNPRMLYELMRELKEEISPMFIQPLIEQGIADGSIKTEYPKELSEMLAILINIWVNPLVFDATTEDTVNRCMLLSEMLAGYNLNIIDDELKTKLGALTKAGKR